MGKYIVDAADAPLIRVQLEGLVDDDAFAAYLSELGSLSSLARYTLLVDATDAGIPPAAQRRMQADFIKLQHERIKEACDGVIFVIPNDALRGVLVAILYLAPVPVAVSVVATREEAERWAAARARPASHAAPRGDVGNTSA